MKAVMERVVGLGVMAIALGGCAHTAKWPWVDNSNNPVPPCEAGGCTAADAANALAKASAFCRSVQNYYEANGTRTSGWKLATAITGTLAGAVAAPIAKGSGKDAWAGLSGSANGLQKEMDDAFSSILNVKRRAAVTQAYADTIGSYDARNAPDINVAVAISMAAKCAMAPAQVDADGLAKLLNSKDTSTQKNIHTTGAQNENGATKGNQNAIGAGVKNDAPAAADSVQSEPRPPSPAVKQK